MWRISFIILMIGVAIAQSEDNVEPEQCKGPPPIRMNPDGCCKKPIFKPDFRACMNKTRQVMVERYRNMLPNKNEGPDAKEDGTNDECLANCFSEKEIFTEDGINRDELIKVLESITDESASAWTPIHTIAVDECTKVLQPHFKTNKNTKWISKCNRTPVVMLLCLNGQYFANCPETHFQTDNENCKNFQEHIKTCPMPGGREPWGPGGKFFGGRRGPGDHGFGQDFGPPPNFRHHSGPPPNFGPNFGSGPNFGTGEVFGFL